MTRTRTAIRWAAAVLLGAYTVVIAKLTLQPAAAERSTFALLDRVATRISDGRLDWSQTEIAANVALFVPAGFLLAIALGRVWAAIALCVVASVCIELAQYRYLPTRVPTVDDVRHNGIGGALGAVLAAPIAYAVRPRGVRQRAPHPAPWPASPGAVR